jgi:hypothetical protein
MLSRAARSIRSPNGRGTGLLSASARAAGSTSTRDEPPSSPPPPATPNQNGG